MQEKYFRTWNFCLETKDLNLGAHYLAPYTKVPPMLSEFNICAFSQSHSLVLYHIQVGIKGQELSLLFLEDDTYLVISENQHAGLELVYTTFHQVWQSSFSRPHQLHRGHWAAFSPTENHPLTPVQGSSV